MKKLRSRIAVILMMMLIVTSFEFVGVFAGADDEEGSVVVTDQSAEAPNTDATVNAAVEETAGGEDEVTAPDPVTGLAPYSSSNAVVLLWDKVDDPTVKYLVDGQEITPSEYKGKNRYDLTGLSPGQCRTAKVVAYRVDSEGNKLESSPVTSANKYAVETIVYRVRIKKGGTLKSHGGPSRTIRVSKGEYVDCYGFGGGKYIFERNGSIFYCNKSRTSKRYALYNPSFNYSRQDAEFFVNARGLSSSTNTLVWVNTYTQHIYRFTGSAGNWTCVNDFECSTGKASTPSPTGVSGRKAIWKKIKKRHGIKWWSPYSDINSFHSKKAKWRIGAPTSNGCIRNYEQNAYDLYVNAPIGTAVLIY